MAPTGPVAVATASTEAGSVTATAGAPSASAGTSSVGPGPSVSPATLPSAAPASGSAAPTPGYGSPVPRLIAHGPTSRPWVALTFDADMTPAMLARLRAGEVTSWYDPRIVATLRATDTPATVFLTGLWSETYPGIVRDLAQDPRFELENHSFDHAGFRSPCYGLPVVSSQASRQAEVVDAARAIASLTRRTPHYFRFPGGCGSPADLRLVAGLGEQPVGWDVVSGDAFQSDAGVVVTRVLAAVHPGAIVVMHLVGAPNAPATAVALGRLIPALTARGYRLVTLAELLSGTPSP